MPVELLLPKVKVPVLPMPSRVALAEAFGVGAGTSLFDKSRYRSHGAITTATWAAGLHGFCLDFNSANPDHVVIPAGFTQLDFTTEDFSLIMRVNLDAFAAVRQLFCRGLANNDGYYWEVRATGEMRFATNQLAAGQVSDSAVGDIVAGSWYTLGISRVGASVRLYRDGLDVTTVVGVHIDPLTCGRTAKIGIWDNLVANPYDGRIEFLRIFGDPALIASEHLAWHRALKVSEPNGRQLNFVKLNADFEVGTGAVLPDKSKYLSHGTITGASWVIGAHTYCLDFNPALPSYVVIPAAHTQLDFTSEDFSIIARINIDDLTSDRIVLFRCSINNDGYYMQVESNGRIDFLTYQAGAGQVSKSGVGSIVVGNWYTVGITRSGASVRLYRDGVDITAIVGTHIDPATAVRDCIIGVRDDLVTKPFDGKIEFLRIFGGIALATSEHLAWHNALA